MRLDFYLLAIVIGSLVPVQGIEWTNPIVRMNRVRAALREKAEQVRSSLVEEVRAADIRLVRKDLDRTADSHPLLASAPLSVNQARSIFETGWIDFYTWVSDLDSEYQSVHKADKLFSSRHYNSSLDALLILHDRCGNARDNNVLKILEALKMRNFDVNYNIMIMDFNQFMCNAQAPQTGLFKIGLTPHSQILANEIGGFIYKGIRKKKIRAEQMNIIGLGISTHLAALVAKHIKSVSGKKINSVLGLDPPVRLRRSLLDRTSADHIHIYHTFKLVPWTGPVTGHATADIVFGGAKRGPQCKTSLTSSCFKGFGVQLFVTTLLFPKLFPVRWCPDFHKFSERFCDSNEYTYVSFPPDKGASGTYQLEIDYTFPFGKGLDGIYQVEEEIEGDAGDSREVSKMTDQEYFHEMEMAISRIRNELMSCIHGVLTTTAAMRCVMTAQPSVRKMVSQHLIRKIDCEPYDKSPTGKKCSYETRTRQNFNLPF